MRIMEIDRELQRLENDSKYRDLRKNLKTLESSAVGSRQVRIGTPENLDRKIELRRNSPEMEDLIKRYREQLQEYQEKIDKLYHEKKALEKELFPT